MGPKPLKFLIVSLILLGKAMTLGQTIPDGARIVDVRLSGTGCDAAEASVVLSPDLKDMSLFFDNYVLEIGNGSQNEGLLKLSKDCHVQIQLQIPDGWQMAFKGADYRGFVNLSSQGTAFHRFSIMQEGAPIVSMKEANLKGPLNDDYHVRSEVRPERVTWSKCLSGITEVKLISQLGVSLNPRNSDRSLTMIALDSTDTSFKQSLSVDWRRCSTSRPPQIRPGDPRPSPGPIRPEPRPRPPEPTPEPSRPPRYGGR